MSPPGLPPAGSAPESNAEAETLGQRLATLSLRASSAALARLPRARALAAAGALGHAAARLSGPRTDVARRNLRIAFPEWSEGERQRVLAESFANLARGAVEFALSHRSDDETLRGLATLEDIAHLDQAMRSSPSGGVVVLTGHVGSWELLVSIMASYGYPIAVVHRARDSAVLDGLVGRWRGHRGVEMLARGSAARGALRALRAGKCLAMPIDQNCRTSEGVFVPFFGRLACTRNAPARIAMRTGVPVVPLFIRRCDGGPRHRVQCLPPLPLVSAEETDEASLENVRRMSAAIEAAIRRNPVEWTWTHRRWRTAPEGEPRPYPRSRPRPVLSTL